MKTILLITSAILALYGCLRNPTSNPVKMLSATPSSNDFVPIDSIHWDAVEFSETETVDFIYDDELEQDMEEPKDTRLRYPHFTMVFHNFKGYEKEWGNIEGTYTLQFGPNDENIIMAKLNDDEKENEDYIETLIAMSDTMFLSEILFDDRINNTLIEFIPGTSTDLFKVSMCYLSSINEVIDYRKYIPQQLDQLYNESIHLNEITQYTFLSDSAHFFFRAMPHTSDMEEVKVVDGKIVPAKKRNSRTQIHQEQRYYEEEIARVKKKYNLRDTLVVIPAEYDRVATLTDDSHLFGYSYDAFLFRIDRYNKKKLIETKYVAVSIAYGC